jgi:hypothetical protein
METRPVTAVGGTIAATALGWAAAGSWLADTAVGDGAGVVDVIARTVRGASTGWAGRTSMAPGVLASTTRTPAASRTNSPRLIALCSQPLAESQLGVRDRLHAAFGELGFDVTVEESPRGIQPP